MRLPIGLIIPALAVILCTAPAAAYEPTAYPGAVWTDTGRELDGEEGTYSQGMVRQGVEWLKPTPETGLQTYAQYNWRFRSKNEKYFNAWTPGVGIQLTSKYIGTGFEFSWPQYTELGESVKNYNVYINWFRYVDLMQWRDTGLIKALPLTTWGNLSYDLRNEDGSSAMGWLKLEGDFLLLPRNFRAGVYAAYNWRFRTHNDEYFNVHGPAAGISVGNGYMSVGTEYALNHYTERDTETKGMRVYFTLYQPWDLKNLSGKKE